MSIFNTCDPDFAIVCIWPDMPIDLGFGPDDLGMEPMVGPEAHPTFGVDNEGNYNGPLGHAGILLIKAGSGLTRYFEFGRYGTRDGRVNTYPIGNAVLADNGWPTKDSLQNIAREITRKSGKNTRMHGNVDHRCGGFDPAVSYAEADQGPYNFTTNSCITYAHSVNKAGGFSWLGPIPVWNSAPWFEMDFGTFSNHIMYFPEKDVFVERVWQIR